MTHLFTPVEMRADDLMCVSVRLKLFKDGSVLVGKLGDEVFNTLLFLIQMCLALLRCSLEGLEVLRLTLERCLFVGQLLDFNL